MFPTTLKCVKCQLFIQIFQTTFSFRQKSTFYYLYHNIIVLYINNHAHTCMYVFPSRLSCQENHTIMFETARK